MQPYTQPLSESIFEPIFERLSTPEQSLWIHIVYKITCYDLEKYTISEDTIINCIFNAIKSDTIKIENDNIILCLDLSQSKSFNHNLIISTSIYSNAINKPLQVISDEYYGLFARLQIMKTKIEIIPTGLDILYDLASYKAFVQNVRKYKDLNLILIGLEHDMYLHGICVNDLSAILSTHQSNKTFH